MTEREKLIAIAVYKWMEGYCSLEEAWNDVVVRFTAQELAQAAQA